MTGISRASAPLLFVLLVLSTGPRHAAAQLPDSVRPGLMSLPCRVPLPRHPTDVVTLDLALLERCSGRPLPRHFRVLADTANEAGVIHEAAVVVGYQLYRQYLRERDLGDLFASLAYVRMAEQTLVPGTHAQALFLGRVSAYHLAARLADRADSSGSCDWWRATQLFAQESLRYRVMENPEFGPSVQSQAVHLDSLATARLEGLCPSSSLRLPPNDSLEQTGRPTALPRPELRPGRPAAQFRR
jgi:hypothetical protein